MQSKHKGYCVKSIASISKTNNIDHMYKQLSKLQAKLEVVIPRSLKPKFSTGMEGLIITIDIEKQQHASRLTYEMEDYLKSAIITL